MGRGSTIEHLQVTGAFDDLLTSRVNEREWPVWRSRCPRHRPRSLVVSGYRFVVLTEYWSGVVIGFGVWPVSSDVNRYQLGRDVRIRARMLERFIAPNFLLSVDALLLSPRTTYSSSRGHHS